MRPAPTQRRLRRAALALAALGLLGFAVAASGLIPLKASSGHWPITEWLLRFGMKRSVATHSLPLKAPANLTSPALIRKGASYYDLGCRSCHGAPESPQPPIAARLLPAPPKLGERIRESDAEKLFYVVKHGMKFTGMPAWPAADRDDEVWAVVAFLLKYPALDAAGYAELAGHAERRLATQEGAAIPPVVAQACVACHGRDGLGRGSAAMPRLAGQRAPYLEAALEAYATGRRHSGMMAQAAAALSPEERREAARYYAGLPPGSAAIAPIEPASAARGRPLAHEGLPAERIPACVECHGAAAPRGRPEYPSLAGQPAGYLRQQLALLREDHRGGGPHAHLMQPIASRLTPEQAHDLAEYFASLTPER